jgi:hypothetical protein
MDKQTHESIESCRPASDDLRLAEMADLASRLQGDSEARLAYDRVQAWDAAISQSIEEVTVPSGLAQRILSRLNGAQPRSGELLAVAEACQSARSQSSAEIAPFAAPRSWSRRRWVAVVASSVAAGLLVAFGVHFLGQHDEIDFELLAAEWQVELRKHKWRQIADAPRDLIVPASVKATPVHWQWIGDFTSARVAAYELAQAGAGKAMLYVTRMARPDLPGAPPLKPQSDTGGKAVAWWQSGGLVYVLVVENGNDYRKFVQPSTTTLA